MSFGAKDDGTSMSSSSEHIVSSPYKNASSVLAVSYYKKEKFSHKFSIEKSLKNNSSGHFMCNPRKN